LQSSQLAGSYDAIETPDKRRNPKVNLAARAIDETPTREFGAALAHGFDHAANASACRQHVIHDEGLSPGPI
jgi:hypothetical protein